VKEELFHTYFIIHFEITTRLKILHHAKFFVLYKMKREAAEKKLTNCEARQCKTSQDKAWDVYQK
jgi:hypothetical protein